MTVDIFDGLGVEIELKEPNDFLKVRETLSRIGVASKTTKTLTQSCHLLHKKSRYAIMHFKELFALDGKKTDFNDHDLARRNTITSLLQEWKLLKVTNPDIIKEPKSSLSNIKVISYKEKDEWTLVAKYHWKSEKNVYQRNK